MSRLPFALALLLAGCASVDDVGAAARAPGDVFRDCPACPQMVVIPAGGFLMGAAGSEPEFEANESPQREVTIAHAFAAGRYEVTLGEYRAFLQATGHTEGTHCLTNEAGDTALREGRGPLAPGIAQTDQHPVVCVSWEDAMSYAHWLAEETGEPYRLLTEAEWEYAARAGTPTPFPWGTAVTTDDANYDGQYTYNGGPAGERRLASLPAGSFPPNAFGLYDMTGNVWEWVLDCFHPDYTGAPKDGSAWLRTESGDCSRRIRRGGSWDGYAKSVRVANRYWNQTSFRSNYDGFRVARDL
jgi:formylglycine-generating enzyme required for sulfatase activity